MKRDGTLWKAILEDVFDDFLLFFFEEEAALFDLEKGFVFLDKELEQLFPSDSDGHAPKFVDKLVKVFTKTGEEEWVLVHVEIQGYDDSEFGKRMFTYFYRLLDRYGKPVTCVAIFTDNNKNFRPHSYNYRFLGTEYHFKFNTYKVIDQEESELNKSTNPFAFVILTVLVALQKGRVTEDELMGLTLKLFKLLLQEEIPKSKIRALMNFLLYYVRFESEEIISKFDAEVKLITNNITTMGIEQFLLQRAKDEGMTIGMQKGVEKGIEKERNEFIKALLTETNFTVERIAGIAKVPVDFVTSIKEAQLS